MSNEKPLWNQEIEKIEPDKCCFINLEIVLLFFRMRIALMLFEGQPEGPPAAYVVAVPMG